MSFVCLLPICDERLRACPALAWECDTIATDWRGGVLREADEAVSSPWDAGHGVSAAWLLPSYRVTSTSYTSPVAVAARHQMEVAECFVKLLRANVQR